MKNKSKIKYPATQIIHWPSGPINACDVHARALKALSTILGSHIVATKLEALAECSNCVNENKTHAQS